MPAIGAYDYEPSLHWALDQAYPSISSADVLCWQLLLPLRRLREEMDRGLDQFIARESLRTYQEWLEERAVYVPEYTWEQFMAGEAPEVAVSDVAGPWIVFTDAEWPEIDEDEEFDDPSKLIDRLVGATFVAIVWIPQGSIFVVLSPHVGPGMLGEWQWADGNIAIPDRLGDELCYVIDPDVLQEEKTWLTYESQRAVAP